MKKTLLLVFVHGFKGGDDTFNRFPADLRALLSHALPQLTVLSITYPRFETRGNLRETVARFKEWLQNKVIDLEVAARTPSPTIDPSVRVVLVGHSMGGIVAAETLLSIARDTPISPARSATPSAGVGNNTTSAATAPQSPSASTTNLVPPAASTTNLAPPEPDQPERASSAPPLQTPDHHPAPHRTEPTSNPDHGTSDSSDVPQFLFPYIQAVLAFDTPYLGIHPGVVAHGAETHYNTASAAWTAYNTASKFFSGNGNGNAAASAASTSAKALPPAESAAGWGKWGKYALFAGGAAAVAAAGGAAWKNRDHITEGWSWVGSHLEFVGCLARGAELAQRLEAVAQLSQTHGVGFADFYTALGADKEKETKYAGQVVGEERTFCVVPKEVQGAAARKVDPNERVGDESPSKKRKLGTERAVEGKLKSKGTWVKCTNAMAGNEIAAHTGMFTAAKNPDYFAMGERARNFVTGVVDRAWMAGSGEEEQAQTAQNEKTATVDTEEAGASAADESTYTEPAAAAAAVEEETL